MDPTSTDRPSTSDPVRVTRRRLLIGAAWTSPVIMLATGVPAAASSLTATLEFTEATYLGTACGTVDGVTVLALDEASQPVAGAAVAVTLSDGYTFEGGDTTFAGTTDAAGAMALPAIVVPAEGGATILTATAGVLQATATLSADPVSPLVEQFRDGPSYSTTDMPTTLTVLGAGYSLDAAGQLYYGANPVGGATGIVSADALFAPAAGAAEVGTISSDGTYRRYRDGGLDQTITGVAAGSVALGSDYWYVPGGEVIYRGTGTGVAAAAADAVIGSAARWAGVVTPGGQHVQLRNDAVFGTATGSLPAGTQPLGPNYWLTPGGELRQRGRAAAIDTGVTSATALNNGSANYVFYVVDTGSTATHRNWDGSGWSPQRTVPVGSVSVGAGYTLSPAGELYHDGLLRGAGPYTSVAGDNNGSANWADAFLPPTCPVAA
ncbi:hypothetical protein [Demequina sp. NBRC 110056]|uniref:hypothetical protein n=1 Tax=Demequina sp. NBRC 110056 TaxID=1570345 RepID=UPI0009FBF757|nr:hypothetical protein [Demequina sp. NBRC 110056]